MLLFTASSALLIAGCAWAAFGHGPPDNPRTALAILAIVSAGYAGACVSVVLSKSNGRKLFFAVLAVSTALRFTAWFIEPEYTTDYYRYVWDGKVAAHGINPYRYPPNAPELKQLRTKKIYTDINFKQGNTGYGPAAEGVFRALYEVFGSNLTMWRLKFFGMEAFCLVLLVLALSAAGVPLARVAIYALNPLVILELCANMHLDVIMLLFIVAAVYAMLKSRHGAGAALMAGATLVKFFPVLLMPAMLSKVLNGQSPLKKRILSAAACCAVFGVIVAAGFAFYMQDGVDLFAGIKFFSNELTITVGSPYDFLYHLAGDNAKLLGVLIAAAFALNAFRSKDDTARLDAMFLVCVAVILFSPVQRSWYFTWALPFCCFRPRWYWLAATCLCMLPYGVIYNYDYLARMQYSWYAAFYFIFAAAIALKPAITQAIRKRI